MAKPFLKSNSSICYVRIKEWNASTQAWQWKNKSSGTDDIVLAESLQESLQNAAYAARKLEGRQVSKKHIEALILNIYANAGVLVEEDTTWPKIKDQMAKYMSSRKARVKDRSYDTYRGYRKQFYAFIPDDATLDWLTPQRANEWYESMLKKTSPKTTNERIRFVSRFYERCMRELEYPSNPCKSVEMAGSKSGETLERLPFTLVELRKLVRYLSKGDERHQEWSRAVMVSAMTGARLEDAVSMRSESIVDGVLTYTQTKTGKTLSIPLAVPAWAKILSTCDGLICPNIYQDYVKSKCHNISQEFTGLVSDAGIDQEFKKFKSGRKVARKTFHSLRHTLRTLIVSSGGSDAQADIILGHSGDQGKTYTHSELGAMKKTLKKVFK